VEVVASLSQGRTAAAQCGLFTYKSVPVIFEPPCISIYTNRKRFCQRATTGNYKTQSNPVIMTSVYMTPRLYRQDILWYELIPP